MASQSTWNRVIRQYQVRYLFSPDGCLKYAFEHVVERIQDLWVSSRASARYAGTRCADNYTFARLVVQWRSDRLMITQVECSTYEMHIQSMAQHLRTNNLAPEGTMHLTLTIGKTEIERHMAMRDGECFLLRCIQNSAQMLCNLSLPT